MARVVQLLFLFSFTASHANGLAVVADLSSLQWKNRIIVVNNVPNEAEVVTLFEKDLAEIDDRDIVWFVIKGDSLLSNYSGKLARGLLHSIRTNYRLGQGETILIGKDGGLKSRFDRVELQAIFSDIDAMPVRQREMQK